MRNESLFLLQFECVKLLSLIRIVPKIETMSLSVSSEDMVYFICIISDVRRHSTLKRPFIYLSARFLLKF